MELLELKNKQVIDFYSDSNVTFWTRKLNVINTGSLYVSDIKKHIGIKDSGFSFSDILGKKKN